MQDTAGGGGYGGTDWTAKTVIEMWQAVENQDTTPHYQALNGWQHSADLLLDHQGQVINYRNSLTAAWPPEKSPAAAAYVARLDALIKSLQETHDAAVANHTAYSSAILSISLSRQKLKQIYDEYTANHAMLEKFENRPAQSGLQKTVPLKPPVPDGRQEQLNNQARSIMYGLSSEIIAATGQLKTPAEYDPKNQRSNGNPDKHSETYAPPTLPPINTYDPGSASSSAPSGSSQHITIHVNNSSSAVTHSPPGVGRQPGLVLGGIHPAPTTPPTSTPGLPTISPGGGGPLPTVISPATVLPVPPAGLPPATRPSIGEGFSRPSMSGMPEVGMRPMPPGGVIGGTPGIGLGQPATGARSAARINPVGGVIQPNSQTRVGTKGRVTPPGRFIETVGGHSSARHRESDEALQWDPDNPWETSEGVSPVVLPSQEQLVDPGPAIGLH